MADYEIGPIRPPSEASSLLVRVTRGCPWNRCEFCDLYKDQKFEARTTDEILSDIDKSRESKPFGKEFHTSVFLQDSDALALPTKDLLTILDRINQVHPHVERITSYARAITLYKKTQDELKELHDAGIKRIHRGLETGYDPLLRFIKKGATQKMQIEGGIKVKQAGITLSDYVMPGIGGNLELEPGRPAWVGSAEETARVCNEVDPDFIRLRTFSFHQNTLLFGKAQSGEFKRLTDQKIVAEIRLFIESLNKASGMLVSDHSLNLLSEVNGKLPDDKAAMMGAIDRYLALPMIRQYEFRLGSFHNWFHTLDQYEKEYPEGKVLEMIVTQTLLDHI